MLLNLWENNMMSSPLVRVSEQSKANFREWFIYSTTVTLYITIECATEH